MSPAPTVGTPTINTEWRVDVDPTGTNTFIQVKGIASFTPAINPTTQDASDFDSAGWGSDAITQRKFQLQLTVGRKLYPSAYDPGQEALRTAADGLSVVHVRWYEQRGGGEAYDGWALVQWEPQGGDGTALKTVNVTLLGQGARSPITNPYSGTVLPIVASVSPTNPAAAGGTLTIIRGSGFTGATSVKFATTNATSFTVIDDGRIAAVAPAHAAGLVDVTVVTPAGTSATSTADQVTYV